MTLKAVARDTGGSGPGVGSFSAANQILGFGGRLTLATATPVMAATVAGAATVYYTPYAGAQGGNRIALYDGTLLQPYAFTELSNVLANSAVGNAGPAAAAVSSVYDLYVWNNAGALTLTRSPAWASAVTRGTGAGTAQQDTTTVPGVVTNKVAITNGPAANRGTYVGTIATNASGTVDWQFGTIAANGGAGIFNVWNQYNRLNVATGVGDSTDTWNYTGTVYQAAHASTTMRVSFVIGAIEDAVSASYGLEVIATAAAVRVGVAIGLNSTTAFSGLSGTYVANASTASAHPFILGSYDGLPGLGVNYLSALEYASGATGTFVGDGGTPTITQGLLQVRLRQ